MVKSTVTLVGGKEMVSRDSVTSALSCNLLGSEQLSAQQALAPVRVTGHFAPKSAKPNITPVCAANIHRQKNGGLERTMQFTALRVIRHVMLPGTLVKEGYCAMITSGHLSLLHTAVEY